MEKFFVSLDTCAYKFPAVCRPRLKGAVYFIFI